ncbi:MAG: hypothetical protein Q9169_006906 [Polycauliona sp. 2 TL-2023]
MSSPNLEKTQDGERATLDSDEQSYTESDGAAEKAAVRRVDGFVLPVIMLIYLVAFLDRSNIGNGRLYGLEEDLDLKKNQFQTAVAIFFATYVSCEVPSAIFLKKLRPGRFLGVITMLWGIVATCTGLVQNYRGMLACRLLLGLAEGPLLPCLVLYLTIFYTRKELAFRFSFIILGGALAGSISGLLAYAIGYIDGDRGLRAWRWLNFIEGPPSILIGVLAFFILADGPETAWYLCPAQRKTLSLRSTRDQREASTDSARVLRRSDVLAAVKDWKVWAFAVFNFLGDIQLFSYANFLPTIIRAINPAWSTVYV